MKIIVLAGGLSTERDVSLSSAAGICRTLVEKGHDAFLLDVFMGLENAPENLEDVFTLPDHGLEIVKNISTEEPDLEAVKASRKNAGAGNPSGIYPEGSRLPERPCRQKAPGNGRAYPGGHRPGPLSHQPFIRKDGIRHCKNGHAQRSGGYAGKRTYCH